MKNLTMTMAAMLCVGALLAANTTQTVTQVETAVTVSADIDYVITSTTPFAAGASVDITNTEHAVVIIKGIKPSLVIKNWLKYVKINGVPAVNNSNCQVKMYGRGAIIFPYAKDIKPLTVFSEQNFGGTSVNDFGLENTGGYMNTLSEAKLNNQIRSFKLKRGYMVTFSTRKEGRGYSRCFIADKEDLEIATLPVVLDKTISSYRVFHWYNAHKAGLASDGRQEANAAVGASWCYDWGQGNASLAPDVEWVPNHIYEDWPSSATCGSVTQSCHMKTNNEPGNSADDHPQDVATVLANWENLMRTGMRLCSESSHDGSMNHLKAFIDSIDARGWRCDLLDLHCYWPSGSFTEGNLNWYSSNYGNGRPIWISEWVWGASWNHNGFWGSVSDAGSVSEANQNTLYTGTKPILEVLNKCAKVERYAYWNSEAAGTHIYHDGKLTKLGEYYATMDDGLGYNPANEFIPKTPRQYDPSNLAAAYNKDTHKVTLTWHERNGEYNASMEIQKYYPTTKTWKKVADVDLQEDEADYEQEIDGVDGDKYRIRLLDVNKKEHFTNEASVVNEELGYGDGVTVMVGDEPQTLYLGGNQLVNGDFELGTYDWTNGAKEPLTAPYFQIVPDGGVDGGAYLQCYGSNSDKNHAQSVRKVMNLEQGKAYYISASGCNNNPNYQSMSTSNSESLELYKKIKFQDVDAWTKQGASFVVNTDIYLLIQLRLLAGVAMFDNFQVCRLFETQEEAMADALAWTKKRAEALMSLNTQRTDLNETLQAAMQEATDANALESQIMAVIGELKNGPRRALKASLMTAEEKAIPFELTPESYTIDKTTIQNPTFTSASNWTTKCGTYTGGDQRTATQAGKPCWNAWWNISANGNEQQTMAVKQTVSGLSYGLYALEAKATTQHYCETDQHAYMTDLATMQTTESEPLYAGKLDLPSVSDTDKWITLSTSYLYLESGGSVEVGFTGSKRGATDNLWMPVGNPTGKGDNREGWWCATDFQLRRIGMKKSMADGQGWGTICLPASFIIPEGVTLYQVAGWLNGKFICVEPVTEPQAGYPYLYQTTPDGEIALFEQGATVASAKSNVNGLRGVFSVYASSRYPKGSLVLINGEWITQTGSVLSQSAYSAFIYKTSNLPVLENWDGVMLPIDGAELSIDQVEIESMGRTYYNLQGQPVENPVSGLFIRNGKIVHY